MNNEEQHMFNPARHGLWDGVSARFGKMKWPKPNLTKGQKIALALGTGATVYYDWCIGPITDPIIRLVVAVFCAWYVVIIFTLFNFIWKKAVPKGLETNQMQLIIKGIVRVMIVVAMFRISAGISLWLAYRLNDQGGLTELTYSILGFLRFIRLIVVPLAWFFKPTPAASA